MYFPVTVYNTAHLVLSLYVPVYPGSFRLLWLASLQGCRVWNEHWTRLKCRVQTCLFLMALVGHTLEKPKINRGRYNYHRDGSKHSVKSVKHSQYVEEIVWFCNINTIFLHFSEMRASHCGAEQLESRLSAIWSCMNSALSQGCM